ncbi:MAG: hypothetical protein V3V00_12580 [Saprospiraceae bacterium]
MNLAKSKVVLKKINTLYQSIELSDEISKIEKDLLRDYVKELYESVLEVSPKKVKKNKKSFGNEDKKEKKKARETEIANGKDEILGRKIEITASEVELEEATFDIIDTGVQSSNGFHQAATSVLPIPQPASTISEVAKVSPDIERLFDPSILSHADYRFSQSPIADITKAMGINERLLIVNLLFNKDQQDFNYVAQKLNYFSTFEEASQFLKIEVAQKYEWGNSSKKEKAIDFIKLVKRKYIS